MERKIAVNPTRALEEVQHGTAPRRMSGTVEAEEEEGVPDSD